MKFIIDKIFNDFVRNITMYTYKSVAKSRVIGTLNDFNEANKSNKKSIDRKIKK